MDALTEFLSLARVEGSLFSRAECGAPWGLRTRGTDTAIFHVIVQGEGFIQVDGAAAPVAWSAGDMLVLPHGHGHVLGDAVGSEVVSILEAERALGADGLPCVHHGGSGAQASILCGTFRLAPEARAFLNAALPPLLHARSRSERAARWLDVTLDLVADEARSGRPGSHYVLGRLADLLFVQALRTWAEDHGAASSGWVGALADPRLGRCLGAIHATPDTSWTAGALARVAGMSRSTLYQLFTDQVGETPSAYLTRWRMFVAQTALRDGDARLAEIADRVGYASEASFSRAFKRTVGEPPSAWRRRHQDASPPG